MDEDLIYDAGYQNGMDHAISTIMGMLQHEKEEWDHVEAGLQALESFEECLKAWLES